MLRAESQVMVLNSQLDTFRARSKYLDEQRELLENGEACDRKPQEAADIEQASAQANATNCQ